VSPQADLEARRQELPPRGDEATGARWATRAQRRSRWVRRTRALWRAARAMAPTLATAVLLVLLAIAYYVKQGYHSPAGYVTIGSNFADRIRLQGLAVNGGGYDGQFSYYIARQPGILVICARNVAACPLDDAPERSERILYPMTVRLLALGQPGLLPYAMLLVNFVAILLTSAVIGQLCVETGMSRWWGAGAGLFCGEVLSLLRDLAEPYSVMWMALAAWFLFKRRPLLSAVALAAALLTREQLLLYVPLLALPLLAQRRRLTLLGSALVALGPFLGWQMFLHSVYGRWALLDSSGRSGCEPTLG
jgi:hypothetical protein